MLNIKAVRPLANYMIVTKELYKDEDFDGISDALRDQISHVLVAVACADGVVTDDERNRLRMLHRLPPNLR